MNNKLKKILNLFIVSLLCLPIISFAQFGPQQIISIDNDEPYDVESADIDGDGDNDVVVISYGNGEVAWFPNLDGLGNFGEKQVISSSELGGASIEVVDVDGDGDLDVVGAFTIGNVIKWFKNEDGLGSFSGSIAIGSTALPQDVKGGDIDNDGDMDLVVSGFGDDELIIYENLDGQGNTFDETIITSGSNLFDVCYISLEDFDSDNDLDIAFTTFQSGIIAWVENIDGAGSFGDIQELAAQTNGGNSLKSADLDGDGDLDLVTTIGFDDEILWFENLDGQGSFSSPIVLDVPFDSYLNGIDVGDIDLDGDIDFVYSAINFGVYSIENLDNLGDFDTPALVSDEVDRPIEVRLADIDGDGDLDLLSVSSQDDKLAWYKNLSTLPLAFTIDANPILCYGAETGAINVNVTGGQIPHTYSWFPSDITGSNPTELAAGTYNLTITDASGNTLTTSIEINQPSEDLVGTTSSTPETGMGGDGSVSVMTTGGTSPYAYLWNTSPPQTTATASGLAAGNYTVTVTDNNGCTIEEFVAVDMTISTHHQSSQLHAFLISPNPSSSNASITLQFIDSPIWSLELTNVLGQTINSFSGQGDWTKEIDVSALTAGTYWVTLYLGNKDSVTKQLLIF